MDTSRTIAIACDHGAYQLKAIAVNHLKELGFNVLDFGVNGPESVHYPIYAHAVCEAIQKGEAQLGVLLCSSGIGMSMAANKHRGIRAALCADTYSARFTRKHNDANVLCMGAFTTGHGLALDILDAFLANDFDGGRHQVRVDMIAALEDSEAGNR